MIVTIGDGSKYERRTSSAPSGSAAGLVVVAPDRERASGGRARTRTRRPARSTRCTWRNRRSRSSISCTTPAASARSIESARRNARSAASPSCHSTRTSAASASRRAERELRRRTTSIAITCAPWRAIATAFSPAPHPMSSTRRPLTSPQSRRSASVGRSGPNCTVSALARLAAPRRDADPTPACSSCRHSAARQCRAGGRATRRPRTPRSSGAPRRRGTAPAATS